MDIYSLILNSLIICNVTLRLLTNNLNWLPKYFNIIDVMFTGILLMLFLYYCTRNKIKFKIFFKYILFFNIILLLGILLNYDLIYPLATLSQIIMLNEPIILFAILINLPFTEKKIIIFNNILLFLIFFEFILGITQVPIYLKTGQSEKIIGTFYGNAEQYAGFLMIGIFYLFGKIHGIQIKRIRFILIILGMLALILLIDNKASWIAIIISLLYISQKIKSHGFNLIYRFRNILVFGLLVIFGYSVVICSSATVGKYEGIIRAWQSGNFFNLGKIKSYIDILKAYENYPHMTLIGSGPGTFYSRASYQFYGMPSEMFQDQSSFLQEESKKTRRSDSMGGIIKKADFEPFYKRFLITNKIYRVGSSTVDTPFNSYASLLGETGILGTLIYLGIYIMVLMKLSYFLVKYNKFNFIYPLIVSSIGFLVYMMIISIYNNWMETGRMTTILWSMIAMVYKYHEIKTA